MTGKSYNVLFLCRQLGQEHSRRSAGRALGQGSPYRLQRSSFPRGNVHPLALDLLDGCIYAPPICAAKAGTSSLRRAHQLWISCSPSAIRQRANYARSGLAILSQRIGVSQTRLPLSVPMNSAGRCSAMLIGNWRHLPLDKLDRMALKRQIEDIGRSLAEHP